MGSEIDKWRGLTAAELAGALSRKATDLREGPAKIAAKEASLRAAFVPDDECPFYMPGPTVESVHLLVSAEQLDIIATALRAAATVPDGHIRQGSADIPIPPQHPLTVDGFPAMVGMAVYGKNINGHMKRQWVEGDLESYPSPTIRLKDSYYLLNAALAAQEPRE